MRCSEQYLKVRESPQRLQGRVPLRRWRTSARFPEFQIVLDLELDEWSARNVYTAAREVRPPRAPTAEFMGCSMADSNREPGIANAD